MGRSRPPFRRLTPAERRLWEAYPTGAWVDLRDGRETGSPAGASWGPARVVRARVIAALVLDRGAGGSVSVPGVRLAGARIGAPGDEPEGSEEPRTWRSVALWAGGLVGYGYRPWLAALWAALLLATGTAVFTCWPPHQIGLDESRHFNAFVYTLDLLVPVSVFEQRGAWEPVGWTQWPANGLIAAGWILATALIAGASRLLRPSSAP